MKVDLVMCILSLIAAFLYEIGIAMVLCKHRIKGWLRKAEQNGNNHNAKGSSVHPPDEHNKKAKKSGMLNGLWKGMDYFMRFLSVLAVSLTLFLLFWLALIRTGRIDINIWSIVLLVLLSLIIAPLIVYTVSRFFGAILEKWVSPIFELKSEHTRMAIIMSSFCSFLLFISAFYSSSMEVVRPLLYLLILSAVLLDGLFIVALFQLLSKSEASGSFSHNTTILRLSFLISMFFLLWSILTVMVLAAIPLHAFKGISYSPNNPFHYFSSLGNAAYFVLVTITTVGYGDMTPKNWLGKLIVIGIILSGLFFLSAFVNAILGGSAATDNENPTKPSSDDSPQSSDAASENKEEHSAPAAEKQSQETSSKPLSPSS